MRGQKGARTSKAHRGALHANVKEDLPENPRRLIQNIPLDCPRSLVEVGMRVQDGGEFDGDRGLGRNDAHRCPLAVERANAFDSERVFVDVDGQVVFACIGEVKVDDVPMGVRCPTRWTGCGWGGSRYAVACRKAEASEEDYSKTIDSVEHHTAYCTVAMVYKGVRFGAQRLMATSERTRHVVGAIVGWIIIPTLATAQTGFERAVVTVDDSPAAHQFFAEATAQTAANPKRAAALAETLLKEYRGRLLEVEGDSAAFYSVRRHVIDLLESDGALEAAWRDRATTPARAMLEEATAHETFDTWPLTEAGLEAGLRVAQDDIERASFAHALRVLDELESWRKTAKDTRRMAALRATAAGLAVAINTGEDQRDLAHEQAAALEALGRFDRDVAAALEAVLAEVTFEKGVNGVGSAERSVASLESFGDESWARIWDDPLFDTLFRRRYFDVDGTTPTSRSRADRARSQATNLTSVPVVIGDVVLVNEGLLLRAWDRLTGHLRWSRSFGRVAGLRPSGAVGDLGEIAARGAAAVTVVGHAFGGGRDGSGEIVRFDPTTSRERWRVQPESLAEGGALNGVFVAGPPLIEGDIVVVPLRKVNSRLETIDYVAGLDLDSGRAEWVQLIASSGGVRMGGNRPFSRLASVDGDIIVSSAVGAVARLDPRTGRPRWLRRFSVPLRPQTRSAQPWEIGGPVVLRSGVACLSPGLDEWLLLDEDTGNVLKRHPIGPGTIFGDPEYLLAFGPDATGREQLIGVGSDIIAIDPSDGSTRLWALSSANRDVLMERPNRGDRHGVRGRVHALSNGLVVPFGDAIAVVDVNDGRIREVIQTPSGGNPVVAGNQFFLASDEQLHAFMPLSWAVAALRERLGEGEASVDEALALLDLARRSGDIPLAMEAADIAVASLDSSGDAAVRSHVLERLLGVLDEDLLPLEEAERIHLYTERIAVTPAEHVRRLLARGDWSMRHLKPRDAVESWQRLLREATFASVSIVERDGVTHSAGRAAAERVARVRAVDPAIEAWLDQENERNVALALASRATAEELLGLVRVGVGSPASFAAGVRAVEILRDERRTLDAVGAARHLARESTAERAREVLTLAAASAEADGRPRLAATLRGEATSAATIQTSRQRLPKVAATGTPSDIEQFEGHLPPSVGEAKKEAWTDRFLVVEHRTLVCRSAPGQLELWRLPVDDPDLNVLQYEPSLVVWMFPDGPDGTLQGVNGESGEVEWTVEHVNDLLPTFDDARMGVEGTRTNRTPFLPWRVEPVMTDQGILLVRADGALALVDPSPEATVKWSHTSTLARVYGTLWDGGLVHLWGEDVEGIEPSKQTTTAVVVSIDPATGAEHHRVELGGGEPRWLASLHGGQLAFATARELAVVDPLAPMEATRDVWRRSGLAARDTRSGWSSGDTVVGADQTGVLVAFDRTSGAVLPEAWHVRRAPGQLGLPVATVVSWNGQTHVVYPDRVVAFDGEGQLLGADAIMHEDRSDWQLLPAEDSLLLVSRRVGSSRYLYRIHRLDPSSGLKLQGSAFDVMPPSRSYDAARLVDGLLLLGTSTQVDAIGLGVVERGGAG